MTPWPCSTCAAPGFRNIGPRGYCLGHWCALVATFDPSNLPEIGLWLPVGPRSADGYAMCRCAVCGAIDEAVAGTSCAWCCTAVNRRWDDQRRFVLTAPEHDHDDARFDAAMRAWAGRLARAVDIDLITDSQAANAWRRAVPRVKEIA